MNTKRIIFWACFLVILGLIIWGLIVAMNKTSAPGAYGTAPEVTAADHILGPRDAKVTVIEYGDFQCPACAAYAPLLERLAAEEATGTVRVVFRHFPLPQHPNAIAAALASEAASRQGKFWEMYSIIYSNQTTWENDSAETAKAEFEGYATQLGLDKQKFASDVAATSTLKRVEDGRAEAQSLSLTYTPTFFVNGKVIANPQGYEAFKALIDQSAK
jgi:protein-disulfide isomerase